MDNMSKSLDITVLGAGSWGTALAKLLAGKGHNVTLWAYEAEVANEVNQSHKNSTYLPEIELPKKLIATNDLKTALTKKKFIVSVIPSHVLRATLEKAAPFIQKDAILVSCSKGIETESGKLISEIIEESLPHTNIKNHTYLSGPSFAIEVAHNLPTTVVIAGHDTNVTQQVQEIFRTDTFLTFTHNDVIGVEVGGAIKNVMAIASGMSAGLGFGQNSRAALITRGLYEIIKIGKTLGANPFTFAGLSGMGDLILTCTSTTSRNYTLGKRLGEGESLDKILGNMKMVAEGVNTTKSIYQIVEKHNITAPICREMYYILYEGKTVMQAAQDLTQMELAEELRNLIGDVS